MSKSTDISVNDTFDQIADVFLTTPAVTDNRGGPEDMRYPSLDIGYENACNPVDSATASAPPSSPKSADFSAPHLTLTDEPSSPPTPSSTPNPANPAPLPSPVFAVNDDCDDYPDHASEEDHSPTFTKIDNNLSPYDDSETIDEITPPETNLSLLYACHLPVQGRLWYGQLAAAIAAEFGSTCFLRRLGDDAVSADLFPSHSHHEESSASVSEAVTFRETDNTASGIIKSALPFTKHWLLHVQDIAELARSGTENAFTPNRFILATSTDPAAMVGVYKTLKSIIGIWGNNTAITLLFIGADRESARGAFNRIASASRGFLNRTISCLAVLPKMEPVRMTHLGVFPYRESNARPDGFVKYMSQIINNENILAITQSETNDVNHLNDEITVPNEEDNLDTGGLNDAPEQRQDALIEATGFDKDDSATPPQLVSIIPELTDLVARSPKAPGVELAIDADGCVHALYTDAQEDHTYCEDDSNPIACLLSVCDWIEDHSSIIRLLRSFPPPPAPLTPPVPPRPLHTQAHLFTAHPQQYRRLMDGRLRIHLLAPVEEIVVDPEDENADHPDGKRQPVRWVHVPVN